MPASPPAGFAVKPTLTGDLAILRPIDLDQDAPALRAMLSDPEALRLTGSTHSPGAPPAWTDAAEAAFRDWYGRRHQQPDRLDLAVVDRATGRCVGEVVINEWDEGNNACSLRILLGPDGRDRGLGTEAVRLMTGYAFERLGLHRVALEVYAFNPRARRAYAKVGFVAEGVLRDALRWEDGWVDAVVMSVLASEWARHHGRPAGR